MLYKKPKDLKYTDMAIWIDANMYKDDVDENKLFEYIWHLAYMLAVKAKFFSKGQYYDDFATYFATNIYFRIKNPKQFDDNSKMKKIKSILNFMKATLYPRKVSFEQEHYAQVLTAPVEDEDVEYDVQYSFSNMLSESVDELSRIEFDTCLHDIVKTFRLYLKRIPYCKDKKMWNNIYISCLLTFLDNIVVDKRTYERLGSLKYKELTESLAKMWEDNISSRVVLYHLDKSMENYIRVLVRELQHVTSKDLSSYMRTYVPSTNAMQYIALSELNNNSAYDWGNNED